MELKSILYRGLRSTYVWIVILVVLGNAVFSSFPDLSTRFYTDGFYQLLRFVYDYTIAFLPFPFIYIAIGFVLIKIFNWLFAFRRMENLFLKLKHFAIGVLRLVIALVGAFYLLWGFNYNSYNLKQRLQLEEQKIDRDYIEDQLGEIESALLIARKSFIADDKLITATIIPLDMEKEIRTVQKELLSHWKLPNRKRVRVRKLKPDGFLLRFSTAGIYIPHALEGHIDGGLHPIQWPATMAHEMGHGYGITDEGECNFIGYITCIKSEEPVIQYSGLLMYYRYLVNNYQRGFMPQGTAYEIPTVIQRDIMDCRKYADRYPDILPAARDIIYDQYLKSHGIKEGLDSYSTIVQMIADYNRSEFN